MIHFPGHNKIVIFNSGRKGYLAMYPPQMANLETSSSARSHLLANDFLLANNGSLNYMEKGSRPQAQILHCKIINIPS